MLMEAAELSNERVIKRNLANVQMRLEDYRGAAKTLRRSPKTSPPAPCWQTYIESSGHDSYRKGDVKLSETYLEKAVQA